VSGPALYRLSGDPITSKGCCLRVKPAPAVSGAEAEPLLPIFFTPPSVQQAVIGLMAGGAAEMVFLGDAPPKYIGPDVPNASRIAGLVCRTTASVAAFIEHGYQESLALVEQHKTVVVAIAQALIDHPKRTLGQNFTPR